MLKESKSKKNGGKNESHSTLHKLTRNHLFQGEGPFTYKLTNSTDWHDKPRLKRRPKGCSGEVCTEAVTKMWKISRKKRISCHTNECLNDGGLLAERFHWNWDLHEKLLPFCWRKAIKLCLQMDWNELIYGDATNPLALSCFNRRYISGNGHKQQ